MAAAEGIDALNAVWEGPAALPDTRELRDPSVWLARTAPATRPQADPLPPLPRGSCGRV